MSEETIVRRSLKDRRPGRTDWARLDAMTEEEIEANARSDPDNPPWTEEELANAKLVLREHGTVDFRITLDNDTARWFTEQVPAREVRECIARAVREYVCRRRAEE